MAVPLEATASAPGKVILLGEHAVVYGQPSVSLAVNLRTTIQGAAVGDRLTVNGHGLNPIRHRYIRQAVEAYWGQDPLRLMVEGDIPSASGMGSSAALSVASVAVVMQLRSSEPISAEQVARAAFETEVATQGAASPNDTTVSAAGGAVVLAPKRLDGFDHLWSIERDGTTWVAHQAKTTKLPLVVAQSGERGRTGEQVAKVRRFVDRSAFARDIIRDIGRLVMDGLDALQEGDLASLGRLMDRNHDMLHTLGVDTPRLSRMATLARKTPGTLGSKLTGAGGGGSLLTLTEDPAGLVARFEKAAIPSFAVDSSSSGLELASVPSLRPDP